MACETAKNLPNAPSGVYSGTNESTSNGLGTRDVVVQVYELSGYTQVEVDVARTNTTTVTLSWVATANVAADSYRVVVAS